MRPRHEGRVGAVFATALLLTLMVVVGGTHGGMTQPRASTAIHPTAYSGVTGYAYGDTNGYSTSFPLAGATVTVYDNCTSLERMSCTTAGVTTTGPDGFFGMNLTAGSGYYLSVSPDATPGPAAPDGFGGTLQAFTAPTSLPLIIGVYPLVPYGNATIVLPGYNCLAAYMDNYGEYGPGCQNPILSWTRDGAYYVNVSDDLVFYSFVNDTAYLVTPWVPLFQTFPNYSMIPNELFITQDGAYLYGWGTLTVGSAVITSEAVNVTTHRVFLYNFTSLAISDVVTNGEVAMTGWDGNDSQLTLIGADGMIVDHDIWSNTETVIGTLPFLEANNIYWVPYLNGFINVEAGGYSGDYVEEIQMTGPASSSSTYSLAQTFLGQWSTAGIVVNGVNGISFNVTSRELSVQAENSGIVYSVFPNGTLSQLLLVTNLNQDGLCGCVSLGPGSESDRPVLIASGPEMATNYNGFLNNSWLISMTPNHTGYYSTNVSPYVYNAHATQGGVHSWQPWFQEGQFFNGSYLIAPASYACNPSFIPGPCTINGGSGAAVGTIWWLWKLGLPEFPFPADAPAADATPPGPTVVTSVSVHGTNATLEWTPPSNDVLLNYTVAWGTTPGNPTHFASVLGSATSYTISGLTNNTRYYATVEAWNLHYHGTGGGISTFVTRPGATHLVVTGATTTSVSLSWTNPVGGSFSNLTVEYGTTPTTLTTHLSVGTVSTYTVNGLQPSTQYFFEVLAWNGSTEGQPSNMVNATTPIPPGATDLAVTGRTFTAVSLSWSNPASGSITNVSIEYGASPASLTAHLSVGVVSAYTVRGLAEGTSYSFEVVTWNGSLECVPSNLVQTATLTPPGATGLTVTGVTATNVSLAWSNPPSGTFSNLTVEFGTSPTALRTHLSAGTVSTYTVGSLTPATTYWFEVVAWNASVDRAPSNIVNVPTAVIPPSLGAVGLTVITETSSTIVLFWINPPSGTFSNITMEYGTAPTSLGTHTSIGRVDSFTVTGLNASTTYYFRAVAWNGSVELPPSNLVNATTSAAPSGLSGGALSTSDYEVIAAAAIAAAVILAVLMVLQRRKARPPRGSSPPGPGTAAGETAHR